MATKFSLNIVPRSETGKGAARSARRAAQVPGVLYGKGSDPMPIKLDRKEFLKTVAGNSVSNMILDLAVEGGEDTKALIREIQVDPVSNELLHIDFNRVSLTERIEIEVPLELNGVPDGVKTFGGLLSHPVRSLTVLCLPGDVPEKIAIDVTGLGLGDTLHVSDLDIPGIEIVSDPGLTVAAVAAPKAVEEPTTEEEDAAAAEGETPEDGEKKDEAPDGKEGGDK